MDIEGGEVAWLRNLEIQELQKIDQIVIEFHRPFGIKEKYNFKKLNETHYLIHFHANNCCDSIKYKEIFIPQQKT